MLSCSARFRLASSCLPCTFQARSLAHGNRGQKAAWQEDRDDGSRAAPGRRHVRHLARRHSLRAVPLASTCSSIAKTLGATSAPGVIKTAERKLSRGGDRVGPGLRLELLRCSMHSEAAIAARRWISTYASRTRILDSRQLVARFFPPTSPPETWASPLAPPTRLPLTVTPPHTRGPLFAGWAKLARRMA